MGFRVLGSSGGFVALLRGSWDLVTKVINKVTIQEITHNCTY